MSRTLFTNIPTSSTPQNVVEMGRDEKQAPLKTPAWEATPPPFPFASPLACLSRVYFSRYLPNGELARRLEL